MAIDSLSGNISSQLFPRWNADKKVSSSPTLSSLVYSSNGVGKLVFSQRLCQVSGAQLLGLGAGFRDSNPGAGTFWGLGLTQYRTVNSIMVWAFNMLLHEVQ